MPEFAEKVEIDDCTGVRATEKALLVRFADGDTHWIPQSQIDDDSEVYRPGDEGTLIVNEWWAKKEGWA